MAASYGTITFEKPGGLTFTKDVYFDDAAGAAVRWDEGSGASATSTTFYTPRSLCAITDVCIATATGQTKTSIVLNSIPAGGILRNSLHLASVVTRPHMAVLLPAGTELKLIQLA